MTPASTSTTATGLASTTLRWPTSENVRKKMTKLEKKKKVKCDFFNERLRLKLSDLITSYLQYYQYYQLKRNRQ